MLWTMLPASQGPANQLGWHGARAGPVLADLCGPNYGAEPTTLDPFDDHLAGGSHRIVEGPLPADGVIPPPHQQISCQRSCAGAQEDEGAVGALPAVNAWLLGAVARRHGALEDQGTTGQSGMQWDAEKGNYVGSRENCKVASYPPSWRAA